MGADPEQFGPAALRLVEAGFDVVDINFGCPVKKVLGRCRGGFLLSQPKTALEIVARVRDALPPRIPVTVKMRRGLDDSPESRENFYTIFDGAFARGVGGSDGPRAYCGSAVYWPQQLGNSGSNQTARGQPHGPGQRRPVYGRQLRRNASAHGRGRRQHRPRRDRQSVDFPRRTRPPASGAMALPFEQRDVLAEHFRLSDETYGERCAH